MNLGAIQENLPSKTLASSDGKTPEGYKINKKRITLRFCANSSGSHKIPLLAIGKYKNLRCIRHCMGNLLVIYESSPAAWITKGIFNKWFYDAFASSK